MYEHILSPVELGGITLKNRIYLLLRLWDCPEKRWSRRSERSQQGAVPVAGHGPRSLRGKKGAAYYKRLCEIIHEEGCLACAQLHQSDSDIKGMIKYIPGVLMKKISMEELRPLLNQHVGNYITKLPVKKVEAMAGKITAGT